MQAIDSALLALTLGLPHAQLCPGNDALQKLMGQLRWSMIW